MKKLERFLNELLLDVELFDSEPLCQFLDMPKNSSPNGPVDGGARNIGPNSFYANLESDRNSSSNNSRSYKGGGGSNQSNSRFL